MHSKKYEAFYISTNPFSMYIQPDCEWDASFYCPHSIRQEGQTSYQGTYGYDLCLSCRVGGRGGGG